MKTGGETPFTTAPPERRYLTLMFIDVVGYTQLSEELEPEELLGLTNRFQQLALGVMERFGGFVANFYGDGVLVYFGYPTAHGNDAERALRAALEMVERVRTTEVTFGDNRSHRLAIRIGVHTGLVIVGSETVSSGSNAHAVVGEAANLTARLQNEAPRDGVVVSRDTWGLVEDLFEFVPLGPRLLKGLSRPIEIFEAVKPRPAAEYALARQARATASSMVGREAALSDMLACWDEARAKSRLQVLVVVGEAGVGKTRLINEFLSHPFVGSMAIVQTRCHEIFASTSLYPIASYLWRRTGLAVGDDEEVRRQKLQRLLDEYGLSSEENLAILADFPGLTTRAGEAVAASTQLKKLKQYDLVIEITRKAARSRPTVIAIEDVHWLDPSSSEFVVALAAGLRDMPRRAALDDAFLSQGPGSARRRPRGAS